MALNTTLEDTRFQEILSSPKYSLQSYRVDPPRSSLFPDSINYPEFFNENLVSPNRVIKEFLNDPHSNVRIFYFQLFRLGFEVETESNIGREFVLAFRRIVFNSQFEILFTRDSETMRDVYNDFQFKKFFAEFYQLLSQTPKPNVERLVNTYPIIDQIMIHILRSILLNQGINEEFSAFIPTDTVFGELSAIIGLNVASYGNCWKFEDSDMFCLETEQNLLFVAYVLDQVEEKEVVAVDFYAWQDSERVGEVKQTEPINTNNIGYAYQTIKPSQPQYNNANYRNQPYIISSPVFNPLLHPTTTETGYSFSSSQPLHTNPFENTSITPPSITTLPQNTPTNKSYTLPLEDLSSNITSYTEVLQGATTPSHYNYSSYERNSGYNENRRSVTFIEELSVGTASRHRDIFNPTKESMISQYYEFEDFTGATTMEKMKVPRSEAEKDKGPVVHFNNEENQIKSMKFGDLSSVFATPSTTSRPPGEITAPPNPQPHSSPTYKTSHQPKKALADYATTHQSQTTPKSTEPTAKKSSIDALLEEIKKYSEPTKTTYESQSYSTDKYNLNSYSSPTYDYTYTPSTYDPNAYSSTPYEPTKDTNLYAGYTTTSYESKSERSNLNPSSYSPHTTNPYTYTPSLSLSPVQVETPSSHPTKQPHAFDYISKYALTVTPETKPPAILQPSFGTSGDYNKVSAERTVTSDYKPSTAKNVGGGYFAEKPTSSYEKYNYQPLVTVDQEKTTGSVHSYLPEYRNDFSNSSIYDIISKFKHSSQPKTEPAPQPQPQPTLQSQPQPLQPRQTQQYLAPQHILSPPQLSPRSPYSSHLLPPSHSSYPISSLPISSQPRSQIRSPRPLVQHPPATVKLSHPHSHPRPHYQGIQSPLSQVRTTGYTSPLASKGYTIREYRP